MYFYKPCETQKEAEKAFKLKIGEPFFALDGLSLTAVGCYESPQVILRTVDGTEVLLNRETIMPFLRAFDKGRDWCNYGWTRGMS